MKCGVPRPRGGRGAPAAVLTVPQRRGDGEAEHIGWNRGAEQGKAPHGARDGPQEPMAGAHRSGLQARSHLRSSNERTSLARSSQCSLSHPTCALQVPGGPGREKPQACLHESPPDGLMNHQFSGHEWAMNRCPISVDLGVPQRHSRHIPSIQTTKQRWTTGEAARRPSRWCP